MDGPPIATMKTKFYATALAFALAATGTPAFADETAPLAATGPEKSAQAARPSPTPRKKTARRTERHEHRGVSGTFRHVGGKLQKFFTGKNTIEH